MRGSLFWILLLTVWFISASAALAGDEQVLRFKSSARVRVAGQDHLVVIADAPRGGHPTRLVVGNKTEGRFDPISELADAIKGFNAGDLIQVTAETAKGVSTLQSIAMYSPKPGELSPGGYVFVATKSDDAAHPAVVVSKLGERTTFALQTLKDDKGAAHVDPALASSVEKLKEGDSVWVDAAPGTPAVAVAVLPWSEPQRVTLVKIEPAEGGGHKGIAVRVERDGKAQVASIPGRLQGDKWVSDARLLAAARRLGPAPTFSSASRPTATRSGSATSSRSRSPSPPTRLPNGATRATPTTTACRAQGSRAAARQAWGAWDFESDFRPSPQVNHPLK